MKCQWCGREVERSNCYVQGTFAFIGDDDHEKIREERGDHEDQSVDHP